MIEEGWVKDTAEHSRNSRMNKVREGEEKVEDGGGFGHYCFVAGRLQCKLCTQADTAVGTLE